MQHISSKPASKDLLQVPKIKKSTLALLRRVQNPTAARKAAVTASCRTYIALPDNTLHAWSQNAGAKAR